MTVDRRSLDNWRVFLVRAFFGLVCLASGLPSVGSTAGLLVAAEGSAADPRASGETSATESTESTSSDSTGNAAGEDRFETELLRGRIVWMAEALERRFGIQTVPEARQRLLALETADGGLHPIAEDIRGRAFRRDERLRELADCELLVRRFHGSPMIQVIRLYSHEDDTRYELDYWCEICAITLFELKACDCCQGDIELRRRPAP